MLCKSVLVQGGRFPELPSAAEPKRPGPPRQPAPRGARLQSFGSSKLTLQQKDPQEEGRRYLQEWLKCKLRRLSFSGLLDAMCENSRKMSRYVVSPAEIHRRQVRPKAYPFSSSDAFHAWNVMGSVSLTTRPATPGLEGYGKDWARMISQRFKTKSTREKNRAQESWLLVLQE